MAGLLRQQHGHLLLFIGIPEADAHKKAVELRLRQGVSAAEFHRVLGGQYHKGVGQLVGFTVGRDRRSEEHTSELQSRENLVCRLLLEKKKTRPERLD